MLTEALNTKQGNIAGHLFRIANIRRLSVGPDRNAGERHTVNVRWPPICIASGRRFDFVQQWHAAVHPMRSITSMPRAGVLAGVFSIMWIDLPPNALNINVMSLFFYPSSRICVARFNLPTYGDGFNTWQCMNEYIGLREVYVIVLF